MQPEAGPTHSLPPTRPRGGMPPPGKAWGLFLHVCPPGLKTRSALQKDKAVPDKAVPDKAVPEVPTPTRTLMPWKRGPQQRVLKWLEVQCPWEWWHV